MEENELTEENKLENLLKNQQNKNEDQYEINEWASMTSLGLVIFFGFTFFYNGLHLQHLLAIYAGYYAAGSINKYQLSREGTDLLAAIGFSLLFVVSFVLALINIYGKLD